MSRRRIAPREGDGQLSHIDKDSKLKKEEDKARKAYYTK